MPIQTQPEKRHFFFHAKTQIALFCCNAGWLSLKNDVQLESSPRAIRVESNKSRCSTLRTSIKTRRIGDSSDCYQKIKQGVPYAAIGLHGRKQEMQRCLATKHSLTCKPFTSPTRMLAKATKMPSAQLAASFEDVPPIRSAKLSPLTRSSAMRCMAAACGVKERWKKW